MVCEGWGEGRGQRLLEVVRDALHHLLPRLLRLASGAGVKRGGGDEMGMTRGQLHAAWAWAWALGWGCRRGRGHGRWGGAIGVGVGMGVGRGAIGVGVGMGVGRGAVGVGEAIG